MSILVSPIRVEHRMAAGASETNVIRVTNTGSEPTRIAVHLGDWAMDGKGNVSFLQVGADPYSCAQWIQVNPVDFRLDPGQTRQIRYSMSVPAEAPEKGYRAAIVMEGVPRPDEGNVKRRVILSGRIVVTTYIIVGNPEIRAQFQDFKVAADNKGTSFTLTLSNQGDVHFRLNKSFIAIKDSKGEEVGRVEVPDIPVLPGATREFTFQKDELALPRGDYLAEAILDVGKEDFLGRKVSFSVGR